MVSKGENKRALPKVEFSRYVLMDVIESSKGFYWAGCSFFVRNRVASGVMIITLCTPASRSGASLGNEATSCPCLAPVKNRDSNQLGGQIRAAAVIVHV